jgi:methionine-rich copper-binding protein CopC
MYAWVLVMIIFAGTTPSPSYIAHMEVLKVYPNTTECGDAIKKAIAIKMPVAREFRCLKLKNISNLKRVSKVLSGEFNGNNDG